MLKIQTIASGSRGNATYISTDKTRILVDIGLGIRTITKRLQDIGISPETIDAVLVTHEHSDHISGVGAFARRYGCDVYIPTVARNCFMRHVGIVEACKVHTFNQPVVIGDITVDFFPVPHDSEFCFGYTFIRDEQKISLATDLGFCCSQTIDKMAGSQVVMLECNHCTTKLAHNVKYPAFLKRRIASNHGHLSNVASAKAILRLACLGTKQVILAHLSQENNCPNLAHDVVKEFLGREGLVVGMDIKLVVATQNEASDCCSCLSN